MVETTEPRDTREKILDVCEALFAARGYEGVGLREVADQVGIGKSSLFHHFPTKLDLYDQVLDRVLARIRERVEPALRRVGDPMDRLDRFLDALLDALAEHPTSARLLLRSLVEEAPVPAGSAKYESPAEQTVLALIESFQRLLCEGIDAGRFRTMDVAHATQSLIGAAVFHFASGEWGERVLGRPIFTAAEVAQRKRELKALARLGLAADRSIHAPEQRSTRWTRSSPSTES